MCGLLTVVSGLKRDVDSVDWSKVSYDLTNVDWSKVDYGNKPAGSSAPAPAPAQANSYTVQPSPAEKPAASPSAKPSASPAAYVQSTGDTTSDYTSGLAEMAKKLDFKVGKNDKSSNGGIWIGDDSQWKAEFVNGANEDALIYCWRSAGFTGMCVQSNAPDVSVLLKPGKKVTLSFAPGVGTACAPAFGNTKVSSFGGIDNTWFEATFVDQYGTFDISREVNMQGRTISAKGSKCTSDMETCVFKCADANAKSCEKGYKLLNCADKGGHEGYDSVMQGASGGCKMGEKAEKITVTVS